MKVEPIIVPLGGIFYLFGERIVEPSEAEIETMGGFRPRPGMDTIQYTRSIIGVNPYKGAALASDPKGVLESSRRYELFKVSSPVRYSTLVLPYESYLCTAEAAQFLNNI
jgi:hypothetical protein